jgi:hypothetical protein
MDMVGHQTPRPNFDMVFSAPFSHQIDIGMVIVVAEKSLLPAIAALGDMVGSTGGYDSCNSCHVVRITDKRELSIKYNVTETPRAVSSQWTSNGKSKGQGNKKNGNKYLSWAFSEAAEFARRYDDKARAYYNRKLRKSNFMVAHAALAHKLARAAYYIMRDQAVFIPEKIFT